MLGFYVHVPFCSVRCGYCDFNTYTSDELGGASAPAGASRATYAEAALAEVRFARRTWPDEGRPVSTVFFGGGTPTLLPPEDLTGILGGIDAEFGLAADAEVTTEANPDSVSAEDLVRLREGGVNRISFGMQSAVRPVLAVLDRTHDPERVPRVVEWARAAGFDQVSLDLIYGTPGESLADWSTSLDAALACAPDHVSAYSLVVEQGTALARRVRRGEVAAVDDDDLADKYLLADERLTAAGLGWYEVSNWARDEAARCRHNLGYWRGDDWWGVGPGAHSHRDGVRWWNVKHPAEYARRLAAGTSPEAEREVLTLEERHEEALLLGIRLDEGLDTGVLSPTERDRLPDLVRRGLLTEAGSRVRLSREGRLLADGVVRDLLD